MNSRYRGRRPDPDGIIWSWRAPAGEPGIGRRIDRSCGCLVMPGLSIVTRTSPSRAAADEQDAARLCAPLPATDGPRSYTCRHGAPRHHHGRSENRLRPDESAKQTSARALRSDGDAGMVTITFCRCPDQSPRLVGCWRLLPKSTSASSLIGSGLFG